MVLGEQELTELIVSQLTDNITDPLTSRAAVPKKWIYDDEPRDDVSGYPRISVEPATTSDAEFAVGDLDMIQSMFISVAIYSKKQTKMTVGTVNAERGEQVTGELSKQVRNFIKNNHAFWITQDILEIRPQTTNRTSVGDRVIDTIVFRARIKG